MERVRSLTQQRSTFIAWKTAEFGEFVFKIVEEDVAVETKQTYIDILRQFFDDFKERLLYSLQVFGRETKVYDEEESVVADLGLDVLLYL